MLDKSIPVLLRTLEERRNTGRPYKNPALECKRKAAIAYLRESSVCGWHFDNISFRHLVRLSRSVDKKPAPIVVLRSVG